MSDSESNTLINGLIGAVVTVLLSFTVVSPIVGGAVSGYLEKTDGVRVGAISGGIAILPLLLLGVLFLGLFTTGLMPVAVGLLFVLFVFVFGVVWTAGLSALGGYLGVYLRDELQ